MRKPAKPAAKPAVKKAAEAEAPKASADGYVEINTDASPHRPSEAELIAAAAERGEGIEKLEGSDGEAGHVAPAASIDE